MALCETELQVGELIVDPRCGLVLCDRLLQAGRRLSRDTRAVEPLPIGLLGGRQVRAVQGCQRRKVP